MRHQIAGDVRPSPIAGTWYPGTPEQLAAAIDELLAAAPEAKVQGLIQGVVVPHAGYRYSGSIAARAFRLLQGLSYDWVVIIAPMHHPYTAPVLTTAHAAYETPLGTIPVDHEVLEALSRRLTLIAVRNDPEHSLEIELPFLQRVLAKPFSLVPLMLRDQSSEAAKRIGAALAAVIGRGTRTLLVASSDLSHFHPDTVARQLDSRIMELIAANDPEGVIRAEDEGRAFACGRGAIASVLIACRHLGADAVHVTGYGTSGETSGDMLRVVGYGSAVIYQPEVLPA
jgi:AmmeMemoRadiSam system protein B